MYLWSPPSPPPSAFACLYERVTIGQPEKHKRRLVIGGYLVPGSEAPISFISPPRLPTDQKKTLLPLILAAVTFPTETAAARATLGITRKRAG